MFGLGDGLAWLAGHRLHLRVTSRPYPTAEWAKRLHDLTPNPLETPGVDAWSEHMVTMQKHLRHQTMADKQVFLGVRLANRPTSHRLIAAVWRHPGNIEHARLLSKVEQVTETVALPGLEGRPATAREMEWLVRRSMGIGLPAPVSLCPAEQSEWDAEDLHSFADSVDYAATPLGRTVKLTSRGLNEPVERHVAVMSVGRLEEIEAPDPGHGAVAGAHRSAAVPGRVVVPVRRPVGRGSPAGHPAQAARRTRHAAALRRARPRRAAGPGPPGDPGPRRSRTR